jgi:uracil-DNA glycosylase family 4
MKHELLENLKQRNMACQRCVFRKGCRGVVFGEGNPDSEVMFVGEGPGQTEDEMGRPFVGKAGELLNRILEAAGIPRESVYITNIVKCRPPGNRTPNSEEMEICLPWLREQYRIIRPKYMVLLGLAATHGILDKKAKMSQCRGKWFKKGNLLIMPTYHPAAILRNPALKEPAWEDFKLIRSVIKKEAGS